ncbi:uncharacterized protein JCM15063_000911 [Sporobolomyces koalae]|uniref:uncharacterized protein n=1 Tax=Sporobolomyces koalae TaxID=500713 RepID=UPI003180E3C0
MFRRSSDLALHRFPASRGHHFLELTPSCVPVASTSQYRLDSREHYFSSLWINPDDEMPRRFPFDDCVPLSPVMLNTAKPGNLCPVEHRREASRTPPRSPYCNREPYNKEPSDFVEWSGLAAFRFPPSIGLLTPASSQPSSPVQTAFPPHSTIIECDNLQPGDVGMDSEDEESEREFMLRVMKQRQTEFDGDMDEWDKGVSCDADEENLGAGRDRG